MPYCSSHENRPRYHKSTRSSPRGSSRHRAAGLRRLLVSGDKPRSVSAVDAGGRAHLARREAGTSIAVAFARNPMTVANVGWDLQAYSQGRFILGLGSQIQPHIEKRFSMPWSQPVRRMREFVVALREIWSCWQDGTKLGFEGDFYTHKLMTPMFVPEPQPHGFRDLHRGGGRGDDPDVRRSRRRPAGPRIHHEALPRRGHDPDAAARNRACGAGSTRRRADVPGVRRHRGIGRRRDDRGGRDPQADRLLRIDPRLPQGARVARVGRLADRAASPFAAG